MKINSSNSGEPFEMVRVVGHSPWGGNELIYCPQASNAGILFASTDDSKMNFLGAGPSVLLDHKDIDDIITTLEYYKQEKIKQNQWRG